MGIYNPTHGSSRSRVISLNSAINKHLRALPKTGMVAEMADLRDSGPRGGNSAKLLRAPHRERPLEGDAKPDWDDQTTG